MPVTSENCEYKTVRRGKDWSPEKNHDYENGMPALGEIYYCFNSGTAMVDWSSGSSMGQNIGQDNSYTLFYVGNNKSPNA